MLWELNIKSKSAERMYGNTKKIWFKVIKCTNMNQKCTILLDKLFCLLSFIPVMSVAFSAAVTPVFSVTWSLRNHFNIPIFGSRNISYNYYEDLQYINLVYMFYKPDLYNVYQGVSASSLISTNGVLGQKKVEDPGCWRLKIREKCLCPVFSIMCQNMRTGNEGVCSLISSKYVSVYDPGLQNLYFVPRVYL